MNEKIFRKLERRAKILVKTNGFRCLHISFVLRRNKVVVYGMNENKTDGFAVKCGQRWGFKHAEMACIKRLQKLDIKPADCIIVNLRLSRKLWRPVAAAPCPVCRKAIVKVGIPVVYYSTNNNKLEFIKLL